MHALISSKNQSLPSKDTPGLFIFLPNILIFIANSAKFLFFVVIIPPEPVVIILLGKKLKTPTSPSVPAFFPSILDPSA